MKIAIAGAGAMGCRFGYMLLGAGHDVTLIDGWHEHVNASDREDACLFSFNDLPTIRKLGRTVRFLKVSCASGVKPRLGAELATSAPR